MAGIARSSALQSSSRPSPAPSVSSNSELKRKRPDMPSGAIYSQPADTGTGRHLMTQVTYAVEYLKDKNKPLPFADIYKYLNISDADRDSKRLIKQILQKHPRVEFDDSQNDGRGGYRYRPVHGVRSADDLLELLQRRSSAQGIPVKELKDGWAAAVEEIENLGAKGNVLMIRNKKDQSPKIVWPNDPTLSQHVDGDFAMLWQELKVPQATNELRDKLIDESLVPTSQVKAIATAGKKQEKKARKQRASGKTTNAHMLKSTLKDYSHLRVK